MKHIFYTTLFLAGALATTACSDYLETTSPSVVDADFVFSNTTTARASLDGAYEAWRTAAQNQYFGDGLFYGADVCGSDIERHPEAFKNQPGRHYPETFYQNGTYTKDYALTSYNKDDDNGPYNMAYEVIGKANAVISAIEGLENFDEIVTKATEPSEMSQMYGEAVALRATVYRELLRNYGDVPFSTALGVSANGLTSRDSIYDVVLDQLQKVEGLMYPVGQVPGTDKANKNLLSQTYVRGLIGRMALDAGGYQTRRADLGADFYKNGAGTVVTFETLGQANANAQGAVYGRRSDWKDKYELAKKYFKLVIDNPGSAKLNLTDPRSASKGRTYGNPYEYFFSQMLEADAGYADESIYEYPMQQGGSGNDARSYSFGRPSSGGSKTAYPCKAYGQGRINPAFYYGVFDPNDMRRDVSVAVTGSTGKGVEKLIPFAPNSKADGGGLSLNKWDENRQTTVWTAAQRKSGINGPYMRMAEMYLGYAEACAALGDEGDAIAYLKIIRQRSFPAGKDFSDQFINDCGSTLRAVIEERGFEFAGEGDRRWTLIRSGFLPDAIRRVKDLTAKMINGLEANGYYQFDNGNVISLYVWTKTVNMESLGYSYRLTAQCPAGEENNPVLYPGWRGQNDDWEAFGLSYGTDKPKTNLAIKGLFKTESPAFDIVYKGADGKEVRRDANFAGSVAEAMAAGDATVKNDANVASYTIVDAEGYSPQAWGSDLVKYADEYSKYLFYDYDYVSAPIYMWPFTPNAMSTGGFTNGYGFKQD